MKKLPISVYFIASNEEKRIEQSLKSVYSFADEIIVVIDEKSKDKTDEIAKNYGAKVIFNDWKGFAMQKAFAAKQCKNDWVLDLDADEEVSEELKIKLYELFGGEHLPTEAAFNMTWKVLYPGQDKPSIVAHTDYIVRLYNKKYASIDEVEFSNNDRPKVHKGIVSKISEPVYHRTVLNFSHLERKISILTQEQAQHNYNQGKKISNFKFYTDFPLKFFKYYFLRRLCFQGWYGFVIAISSAYRNFMRLAKTKELYVTSKKLNKK